MLLLTPTPWRVCGREKQTNPGKAHGKRQTWVDETTPGPCQGTVRACTPQYTLRPNAQMRRCAEIRFGAS